MKEKMLKEDCYAIISPGNTEGYGGVLLSPFYDDKLIDMWLELSALSRDNFIVYKVTESIDEADMSHNFIKDSLDSFIDRYEDVAKECGYVYVDVFEELKEHCENKLGKDFWRK